MAKANKIADGKAKRPGESDCESPGESDALTPGSGPVRNLPPCASSDRLSRPSPICLATTALLTVTVLALAAFLGRQRALQGIPHSSVTSDDRRETAASVTDEAEEAEEDDNATHLAWVESRAGTGTVPWVRGLPQESCTDACARAGLVCEIEEDSWPISQEDVTRIAEALNHTCENFYSTENPFEPSISSSFCSHGPWKPTCIWGDEIHYREKNVRSCEAIPPKATLRLCPCVEHKKPLQCDGCNPWCWKNYSCPGQKNCCCPEILDPCAGDPEKGNDKKYWGSGLSYPAPGVSPDAWCQRGHPQEWVMPKVWSYTGAEVDEDTPKVQVKVLSYNLYWWHLFGVQNGNLGSAGKLISEVSSDKPFDLMGLQECQDPVRVLGDAGLLRNYTTFQGPLQTCVAFRNATWTLLSNGSALVAEDGDWVRKNDWGKRIAIWFRLRHIATNRTVFFMNHHGPLPLHSGGMCGGLATAYNLLQVMHDNMESTDAVILVGDFNANAQSMTVRSMATQLNLLHHGTSFGGVDNFFANINRSHVVETRNYGHGGSDHAALGLTLELTSSRIPAMDRATELLLDS